MLSRTARIGELVRRYRIDRQAGPADYDRARVLALGNADWTRAIQANGYPAAASGLA
jgi:hypothetical protein